MTSSRPIFSEALDAREDVKAWLAGLDAATRESLRDDLTPSFKELPHAAIEVATRVEDDAEDERQSDDVIDAMRGGQTAMFPEVDDEGVRGAIMQIARGALPDWKYRAFVGWFRGTPVAVIARALGLSRASTRAALFGGGSHGNAGAIEIVLEAVQGDPILKGMVIEVAKQKATTTRDPRVLEWFAGLDTKPLMVAPMALLLVLDNLIDKKGEVRTADVLPHFPRSAVTPCLQLLQAHGYVSRNGHTIKVHRTPVGKVVSA